MNNIYFTNRGYYIQQVGPIAPVKGMIKNKVTDEKRMLFTILSPYRNLFYLTLFRLFSDISKDTTIYIKNVAINSVRSFRSKEHSRTCQFFWIQPTTGRSLGAD